VRNFPLLSPPLWQKYVMDKDSLDGRDPWDEETESMAETHWAKLREELAGQHKDPFDYLKPRTYQLPQCECGGEKTYGVGAVHSSWCPKGRK